MEKMKSIIANFKSNDVIENRHPKMAIIRSMTVFAVLLFFTSPAMAVAGKLTGWQTTITTAMTTLVAIYAVVGGFLVFVQYMQGSEQAQKNLIKFIIGLAVFGASTVLVTDFGTP